MNFDLRAFVERNFFEEIAAFPRGCARAIPVHPGKASPRGKLAQVHHSSDLPAPELQSRG
jgi:hypothetical protein